MEASGYTLQISPKRCVVDEDHTKSVYNAISIKTPFEIDAKL